MVDVEMFVLMVFVDDVGINDSQVMILLDDYQCSYKQKLPIIHIYIYIYI